MKQSLKKNFESTIATSDIDYNPSKEKQWKQRKTTVGTLVSLIPWEIYFDKVTSVVQLLIQSDGWTYYFC